ncbi:MAG: metallophosphoesterase [Deltaproteobacteria bacterium]|nr:metallophosphoesterase [Deltaproteobacteria bacterium]
MARMLMFLLVMTGVLGSLTYYVGLRLIPPGWSTGARVGAWAGLAALVLIQPLAFVLRFQWHRESAGDVLLWVAFVAMGVFLIVLAFTFLRDVGWLAGRLSGVVPKDPDRRQALLELTNLGVLGVSGGTFAWGLKRALARPTVVDVTIPVAGLPAALEGFTIAHVSDIHIGPTIKRPFLEEVVAVVNSMKADLVAVTGDLVDGSVAELGRHTEVLGGLRARHGAWFVTGNHEYYSGVHEWIDEVRRLGLTVLLDEHRVVDHDGHRIVVGGVTDYTAASSVPEHKSDPEAALAGAPTDAAFKLLLAHQPRNAYAAAKAGFQLQLSGHTHGGQLFPGNFLIHLVQPFAAGLHRLEQMWIYTNTGTGYWGPPVRTTRVTSEVTRIVLKRA